jgi:hypothetical protein
MSSSASNEVYDMLIKLWDKLTRLNGAITPEAVDKLEDELSEIFTTAKTHHYTQGQTYGHLASAIPKSKYRLVIGNATWTHTVPTNPGAYSADALNAGNAAATCKQFVALGIAQNQAKQLQGLPECQRGREGTHPLCSWRQRGCSPQEAIYQLWQHDSTSNYRPSTPEDGNQDDNCAKI